MIVILIIKELLFIIIKMLFLKLLYSFLTIGSINDIQSYNHLYYDNINNIQFYNDKIKVDNIDIRWRYISDDVIPPIPELTLKTNNYSLCLKNNKIGLLSYEENYGKCGIKENNTINYIDGGNFYIIEKYKHNDCINKNKEYLEYHFNYLLRNFIKSKDIIQIEKITNYSYFNIIKELKNLDYCDLIEILSSTRFYNHKLNKRGLHLIRYILSENIYYYNLLKDNIIDEDLKKWITDGILIKDFNIKYRKYYYKLIKKINLDQNLPPFPFKLIPRDVVIRKNDPQNNLHIDTFSKIIKIWFFDNNHNKEDLGPLNFVKGSHRSSYNKLSWLYYYGQENNSNAINEPSFRLENIDNNTEIDNYINHIKTQQEPIYALNNTNLSIVIADTSAFHCRGKGKLGNIRKSWRIEGDNDGGIKRRNPFYLNKINIQDIELEACNTDCGFIKIKENDKWYLLNTYQWTMNESNTICKHLGFYGSRSSKINIDFNNTYKIKNYDIKCKKNEININNCLIYPNLINKGEITSVSCYNNNININDYEMKRLIKKLNDNKKCYPKFINNTLPLDENLYIYKKEIKQKIKLFNKNNLLDNKNNIIHSIFDNIKFNHIVLNKDEKRLYNILKSDGLVYLGNNIININIDYNSNINISRISNKSIITIYRKIPDLDKILNNNTINNIIKRYLGGRAEISGYKYNILDIKDNNYNKYISSLWHHDNVGKRLKLFILVSDIDCIYGHPTSIALGTNKLSYYFTDSFKDTRFNDNEIRKIFNIQRICGKKGDMYLFDTNTIHRGEYEGRYKRKLIIIEYHNDLKCKLSYYLDLKIPCPSGDQYIINHIL